jgi:HSP20 family protein
MEVARIQSEINRLFDNLLDLGSEDKEGGSWIPNADILETEEALLMKVELPGVNPDKLSLSVLGGNLIIRGEKDRPALNIRAEFHVAERLFGKFKRVINLGVPVNTRQAKAVLNNGLLRIRFPKVPNRRGEEVPIEVLAE